MNPAANEDIVAFAIDFTNKFDPSYIDPYTRVSKCGQMKIEVTPDCPTFLRRSATEPKVQINPVIAEKYDKPLMLFFIVWGFLKTPDKSDIQTDNETLLLLTNEYPAWISNENVNLFCNQFISSLSLNVSDEAKNRIFNITRYKIV
jgi:hypothetical protein